MKQFWSFEAFIRHRLDPTIKVGTFLRICKVALSSFDVLARSPLPTDICPMGSAQLARKRHFYRIAQIQTVAIKHSFFLKDELLVSGILTW